MNDTIKVNVSVEQIGPTASQGTAREHKVTMDRPEAKGGKNQGAMGGENLLMSLGGCFMSNLLAAAQSRDTHLDHTKLEISGSLASAPPRFTAVEMRVSADSDDPDGFQKLVSIAERGCIVANTLKNAVELNIVLA